LAGTYAAVVAFNAGVSGGSANPAYGLGTLLVDLFYHDSKFFKYVWVYVGGALIGGALAALFYNFVYLKACGDFSHEENPAMKDRLMDGQYKRKDEEE
jgi:hypothetical protein